MNVVRAKEMKCLNNLECSLALSDVMQAARYGDLEDVQGCLAQGTSVSSQDTQGRTGMYEFQPWLLNTRHSFIVLQFR